MILPFEEAHCEFKTLQPVSPIRFWGNTFLFDAILQILFLLMVIGAHWLLDSKFMLFHLPERSKFKVFYTFNTKTPNVGKLQYFCSFCI